MTSNTVGTWMTPAPITIGPHETTLAAYEKMKLHHIRRLPVVDGQALIGILTIDDIRDLAALIDARTPESRPAITAEKVSEVMTRKPLTITPNESVGEAARLMMKHKIGGLPVVDHNALVGVISEADLFRLVIAESWRPQTVSGPDASGDENVNLANGQGIHIRPIRPDDAAGLQASLLRASAETIYDRFMGYKKALSDDEARYLASLDYDRHMALIAVADEIIIGVARYHLLEGTVDEAEFAIVISDQYQRQGLGTHLMKRLMEYAQAHGIRVFVGFAHAGNVRLLRFVQRSGLPIERRLENGIWEVRVELRGEPFQKVQADLGRSA